ncbi:MAG TPA: glycosyltransferase family 39 protein [Ktedonobacteraceae bacterium]|nr:glycosyltransferase family 39 protein [Ktedonobacteraceae bacterium]
MKINLDVITRHPAVDQARSTSTKNGLRPSLTLIEAAGLIGLTLLAFVARIILANQLDLVTDERIYISAGSIYVPLLKHLNFTSVGWAFNYEHPPLVKILIGLSMVFNSLLGSPLKNLMAARLPNILAGTALVAIIYLGTRRPFGRVVATVAALCIAVSPWMVYFSALAYLDMTMTALATTAYLLLWPALRRPYLYPVAGLCLGLAAASKYTAVLIAPAMILFPLYCFVAIRPRLKAEARPPVPWRWWLSAIGLAPLSFLIVDPALWRSPIRLLIHSFDFEINHAEKGHITFLAGKASTYVPHWAVLYILSAKISLFVTVPALLFIGVALVMLYKFHLPVWRSKRTTPNVPDTHEIDDKKAQEMAKWAFLLIWLVTIVFMLSQLNIIVGTHYLLPAMPPIALAGTFGLSWLLRYRPREHSPHLPFSPLFSVKSDASIPSVERHKHPNWLLLAQVSILAVAIVGPHLFGLLTVQAAEGYTSELYQGENSSLQVAYPAYRDGALWLIAHTSGSGKVGLVAKYETLTSPDSRVNWNDFNRDLPSRLQFIELQPENINKNVDYLIWPMHLIQRKIRIPADWHPRIVHIIGGGSTIYCYILARNPSTIINPSR